MAEEALVGKLKTISKTRNRGHRKVGKAKKKMRVFPGMGKKVKIDKKLQKLYRKRAREYNSDDEDEDEDHNEDSDEATPATRTKYAHSERRKGGSVGKLDSDEEEEDGEEEERWDAWDGTQASDEEEDAVQPGITKFTEGCRAFKVAFAKIMKRHIDDESMGPILSAHKKLVAAKLAEEEAERKVKGEAKKEKHLDGEKGHVKPANFLVSHEKFLIGIATKGVVKLFNAVHKAQNANKGSNPSSSKDARVFQNRRKQAFFSELSKASSQSVEAASKAEGQAVSEQPSWAPLRDTYMLTNSKLKDWDKMVDTTTEDDKGTMPEDSSDDDE
ncbi:hypothetical protein Ancab_008191 [Ancistrocladus abbreviatus]